MFTYVNTKFVYVERHVRNQITSLYQDIILQKCELERQVIQNILSLATILPDEFAFWLMKALGYMSVMAGEAIHVVKCIPVEVTVRKTNTCHTELPITVMNTSLYMTPKSRIITKQHTVRICISLLPILYNIDETWIQLNPDLAMTIPPQEIKPLTKFSWKYLAPKSLAVSGIYFQRDLDELRDHIMFPAEKNAVLHTIARGFTGQSIPSDTVSLRNLLDENSLNKIYDSTLSKIWNGFTIFGTATDGVFGIFLIIRLIKIIFDTLIHGYALHAAYGCSLHLLVAIWNSFTHLLLYLANKKRNQTEPKQETQINEYNNSETTHDTPTVINAPPTGTHAQYTQAVPIVYSFRDLRVNLDGSEQIS